MAKLSESLRAMAAIEREHYERDQKWQAKTFGAAADRYILQTPNQLSVEINDVGYAILTQTNLDLSLATTWDQVVTDYRVAATRAGKDFYVYACQPSPTNKDNPVFLISANSTFPDGYDANNSRNVGGFHCLCVAVGTIAGHTLTNYVAGDILPQSVWDILHRPVSSPVGMVYSSALDKWIDIYLASGTGASTTSVNEGTISDTRNWMDFVADGHAVKKRLLDDEEFQSVAAGSNEETNITGSADPVTTSGHVDTAGRRMISNIGCEDCAGAVWQWLKDNGFRYNGGSHTHIFTGGALATHTHTENQEAAYTQNVQTAAVSAGTPAGSNASVDPAPAFTWYDLPGAKGSLYKQGTYGDVKLRAGGNWNEGAACGSRSRNASNCRWDAYADIGARLLAEPL
uniref:Putative tail protein n=1 Tax=viral metagenome TaxID=1070528 RepID=A0A6H1ZJE6_9ZZZZ